MSTSYLFQCIKLHISTKFHCDMIVCSKDITISLLEAWNLVPQSKNSTWGHFQLMSTPYLFQCIKLPISTKFHCDMIVCSKVITISLLEAWNLVPSLKIAHGGIFQLVSTSYLFQCIKLPIPTKFHAGITFCTIIVIISPTKSFA